MGSATADEATKLDTIRVAVSDGDSSLLADITPQAAPFQVVGAADGRRPRLDAGSRQAMSKGEIIAYDVGPTDLAAVIDRMALAEGLCKLAAAQPQPISIAAGSPLRRKGDKIETRTRRYAAPRADAVRRQRRWPRAGALSVSAPTAASSKRPAFAWTFEVEEPLGPILSSPYPRPNRWTRWRLA